MPGILPLFASAPRCVLKVNGKPIGFAIGLSLNVRIDVQPVKILGEFIIQSLEPTAYLPVEATLQVVRLLSNPSQVAAAKAANANMPSTVSSTTVSEAKVAVNTTQAASSVPNPGATGDTVLSQAALYRHVDPASILLSQTFDIEIYLKVPNIKTIDAKDTDKSIVLNTAADPVKEGEVAAPVAPDVEESFITIKDCRISSISTSISANELLVEPMEIMGRLLVNESVTIKQGHDDSFKDGKRS